MKEETFDYSKVPHNFGLCATDTCPYTDTCLRRIAYTYAPSNNIFLYVLNPKAIESTAGKCICCPALLNSWIKKYSNLAEELSLPSEQESPDMSNRSKEAYKDENAQLKKRIKELEKALSFSKLETEARELMITRAEELFNIPIRKKSGAKS